MLVLSHACAFAADGDFPEKPNPPRLVNDFAGMMSGSEASQLESKLLEYEKTSSTQITVVTIKNLGGYAASDYAIELGMKWGVGQKGKDNGVMILASLEDRKAFIAVGYGLEGALTDALTGQIYRNEMVPSFKQGNYYEGFNKAAEAIIKATKGEYKAEEKKEKDGGVPVAIIIVVIIIIIIIASNNGSGGGTYMSGRGFRGFGGGFIGGSGFGGGWGGGGGSSSGGGGFGGFGGGSFGGGGAGGSW
jgi:uncharacterized protein